jgi:hypothetical protein
MSKNNKIFLLVPVIVVIILLAIIGLGHLFHPSWVGEQSGNAGYWQKAFGLITDAPHATAELFYSTLEDLVILSIGIAYGKRRWKQEHKTFDEQHDIEH